MQLLITGANSGLARAFIDMLGGRYEVRAVDNYFDRPMPDGIEMRAGNPRDRAFAEAVVAGCDAILHLSPMFPNGRDEDAVDSASRGTYNLIDCAINAGVKRFLLGSSLALFDRHPADWNVDEMWRPRPEATVSHLVPWLAELSLRECARTATVRAICLRFGQIVTEDEVATLPYDSRWLHLEDAVQALLRGLTKLEEDVQQRDWRIYHISSGEHAKVRLSGLARQLLGAEPKHDFAQQREAASKPSVVRSEARDVPPTWRQVLAAPAPISSRPIRKVVIFGAGGPVATALAEELKNNYVLRLTDVRSLEEIRIENKPQFEGAPLPSILPAPHEHRLVDVRNYEEVLAACEGMDAIYNCTVVRPDPVEAFRVNTLGAYSVMRAAVEHKIRRVVQTGPEQVTMDRSTGYMWDYDIPGNVPARPGRSLYGHSKFLGQEICRVFAEYYDLEVPVLLYSQFLNPSVTKGVNAMAVTWQDSARALRCALEVPSLPSPFEVMHITNDLPHGKFSGSRAKATLDWEPLDDLSHLWKRTQPE